MKTIVVKIITEKVYKIEFDEEVFNREVIDNYEEHIDSDVKDEPEEFCFSPDELDKLGIVESDYPFFNIAKQIVYLRSEYDSLNNDGMPDIHETIYTRDGDTLYGAYLTEESIDCEYEFDFDRFEIK